MAMFLNVSFAASYKQVCQVHDRANLYRSTTDNDLRKRVWRTETLVSFHSQIPTSLTWIFHHFFPRRECSLFRTVWQAFDDRVHSAGGNSGSMMLFRHL